MGERFRLHGVEFDTDEIERAHLRRGYTGGELTIWTRDGEEYCWYIYIRDSREDHDAYVMLKYHTDCYTETWPKRSWGGGG
ncbi:hypothetical protein ABT095_36735 [Kitasatospora sp. NPDC002227]|uniref:hypothetical protein n=1 Tax=Kitasatospora sp. NPDC002227 TaxID=3154773 RepID=UPI00332C5315